MSKANEKNKANTAKNANKRNKANKANKASGKRSLSGETPQASLALFTAARRVVIDDVRPLSYLTERATVERTQGKTVREFPLPDEKVRIERVIGQYMPVVRGWNAADDDYNI